MVIAIALVTYWVDESVALAQTPLCIPGTPFCARTNAGAGVQAGGAVQGQARVDGAGAHASGEANARAKANADATAHANAIAGVNGAGQVTGHGDRRTEGTRRRYYSSTPVRFGAGVTFCGTLKAGVYSGLKAGPCFAVSFRTEPLTFEMESQVLFGGTRHTVDWVFPMSFVVPLTSQRSLYEGLQLRVGGSPIGVTFAKASNGGNYLRFGLHAGLSYEYSLGAAATWRVFDARTFLDFGAKREVDLRHNFLDFGGQLSTGIVF